MMPVMGFDLSETTVSDLLTGPGIGVDESVARTVARRDLTVGQKMQRGLAAYSSGLARMANAARGGPLRDTVGNVVADERTLADRVVSGLGLVTRDQLVRNEQTRLAFAARRSRSAFGRRLRDDLTAAVAAGDWAAVADLARLNARYRPARRDDLRRPFDFDRMLQNAIRRSRRSESEQDWWYSLPPAVRELPEFRPPD